MTAGLLEARPAKAAQPSPRRSCRGPAIAFWLLTSLYLVPVWAFHYLPTQDGPAHLSSAVALKDYGQTGTRYHEFYEVRSGPLPNWLAHLLLAGLMYLFPPLVAEKVLVSLYVIGFAWAARYFLTGLGGAGRLLASAALLFVFGRCFWLGFYNFCLSLIPFWVIVGYMVRRRDRLRLRDSLVLALLFLLAYFSHLFGFLVAAGSAAWLAVAGFRRPVRALARVGVAALPAGVLGIIFLAGTGFFGSLAADRLGAEPLAWLREDGVLDRLRLELLSMQWQIFEPQAGGYVAPGLLLWGLLGGLALASLARRREHYDGDGERPRAWPVAGLGGLFFLLYLLVPDHLGAGANTTEHGGFLKARLALLPALLWLACFPEPRLPLARHALCATVFFLVGLNLVLVTQYCQHANRELEEYTAGLQRVGGGRSLFVLEPEGEPKGVADPLLHAACYYCLETGNVCLENYQPATNHFPLMLREGVTRGFGDFTAYARPELVDVVLDWQSPFAAGVPLSYREVLRRGRLRLLAKD
jgi:hypothetical protein